MDLDTARAIAEQEFGVTVAGLRALGGNEDINYLLVASDGARYVLKATATPRSALEAQAAALEF